MREAEKRAEIEERIKQQEAERMVDQGMVDIKCTEEGIFLDGVLV